MEGRQSVARSNWYCPDHHSSDHPSHFSQNLICPGEDVEIWGLFFFTHRHKCPLPFGLLAMFLVQQSDGGACDGSHQVSDKVESNHHALDAGLPLRCNLSHPEARDMPIAPWSPTMRPIPCPSMGGVGTVRQRPRRKISLHSWHGKTLQTLRLQTSQWHHQTGRCIMNQTSEI